MVPWHGRCGQLRFELGGTGYWGDCRTLCFHLNVIRGVGLVLIVLRWGVEFGRVLRVRWRAVFMLGWIVVLVGGPLVMVMRLGVLMMMLGVRVRLVGVIISMGCRIDGVVVIDIHRLMVRHQTRRSQYFDVVLSSSIV